MQGVGHKLCQRKQCSFERKLTNTYLFISLFLSLFICGLPGVWRDIRLLLENSGEAVECCSCGWSWRVHSWHCNKREMLDIVCSKPRAELLDHQQLITWKAGCARWLPTIACIITSILLSLYLSAWPQSQLQSSPSSPSQSQSQSHSYSSASSVHSVVWSYDVPRDLQKSFQVRSGCPWLSITTIITITITVTFISVISTLSSVILWRA